VSRVAIVTGAARGIGAASVDALVNDGYHVIAVDRCRDIPDVPYSLATSADLDAVVARHGDSVLGLVGDVRSASDMRAAVDEAVTHFGGLQAAVAAAGVISGGPLAWEIPDAQWDVQFGVNVNGVRHLASAAVPAMLAAADPFTERVQKGDKAYYRARFAGFDKATAEATCKLLKRSEIECMALKN